MILTKLDLFHVAVPLRKPIKHASHTRSESDNLIVRAELADGSVGYGEGVPRSYVTGETIESTFEALARFDAARYLGSPADFPAVSHRLESLTLSSIADDPRAMRGNAARCALELALLDAYGRHFGRPAAEALRIIADGTAGVLTDRPVPVRYSTAITAEDPRKERISAWKMRIYGFHQVKVKVGVAGQDDPSRLRVLRRILGHRRDIRLDANEAWRPGEVLERMQPLLRALPSAIEQPVAHADIAALAEIRPRLTVPVMLDESLCGYPDAVRAADEGLADILNVRLSKCGGLLPSLRLVRFAAQRGLGVQLGCHPGETGILSAAGRHFAANVRNLHYLEGSYDRHVLAANVINEDVTFGYGGRARPLTGPGLGVTVDEARLDRLTIKRMEVDLG